MMQYDKEFHLYRNSWDVYRKSMGRNREEERVEEFVCMVCLCVCVCFSKTRPHFQHIASNCFLIEQIVDTGSNTQRSHV